MSLVLMLRPVRIRGVGLEVDLGLVVGVLLDVVFLDGVGVVLRAVGGVVLGLELIMEPLVLFIVGLPSRVPGAGEDLFRVVALLVMVFVFLVLLVVLPALLPLLRVLRRLPSLNATELKLMLLPVLPAAKAWAGTGVLVLFLMAKANLLATLALLRFLGMLSRPEFIRLTEMGLFAVHAPRNVRLLLERLAA